jgi:hypothetical protein
MNLRSDNTTLIKRKKPMVNKYLNTINREVNGPDTPPKETDYFDEYKWSREGYKQDVLDSIESLGEAPKNDEVNNPAHYNIGAIECIDAIEAMLTFEEFVGYLRGNSLKYRWRFRYKDNPISDLSKASWYERKLFNSYKEVKESGGGQKSGKDGSI